GALMARAGVESASLNVLVNLASVADAPFVEATKATALALVGRADLLRDRALDLVRRRLG
ncbi:MAG: cyclodeaminase/cyclohydrolase family protein, partial [Treponema sp.]|nr:cyclodeaminase/cyclohydrolase family protein [Treponema sp.]